MVVIQLKDGQVRGKIAQDIKNQQYFSFQGIPYAKPPIGPLRFKAPQPVEPWNGTKDCTMEGEESVSRHMLTRQIVGSEDCLNLNVYTSKLPARNQPPKAVMVWIHGGILVTGSNKTEFFGPEFLVAEDIVLVTINYRLGFLGFISFDDPDVNVPGNAGFKDMVLALKWVQRNIAAFNGDSNNVTVFGESAGGVAAHLLMLSPMAKGLLHKVIAQSGCAINTWAHGKRGAREVATALGFANSDDRKILPFLQSVPAKDLVRVQSTLENVDFTECDLRALGVVIEQKSAEEAFLTKHPIEIILAGDYQHIPLILGYNWNEGMVFDQIVPPANRERFFYNKELAINSNFKVKRGSAASRRYANQVRQFYYGTEGDLSREKHIEEYYIACTDTCFLRDIYFAAKAHSRTAKQPIYFYRLSLESELNIFKKFANIESPGVCHGDDIGYLFKTAFTPDLETQSIEEIGQRRVTKLWTNFAKFSNPTPDNLLNVKWSPIDRKDVYYLDIGKELVMKKNPEEDRMKFWTNLVKFSPLYSKI